MLMRKVILSASLLGALLILADANGQAGEAGQAMPGPAASSPNLAQPLDGVVITARPDPLRRSDRHLAKMKKALPGLDEDVPRKENVVDRLQNYAAVHSDPNATTGQQRQMMEKAINPP